MYNFPSLISQLSFRPKKRPCTNVQLVFEENEYYIHWTPGKASFLTEEETLSFNKDTGDLLLTLGMFSVTLGWNQDKQLTSQYQGFDLQCVDYWKKWGPLYPIPGKKYLSDTNEPYFRTNLIDLTTLGLTDLFISVFWNNPDDEIVTEGLKRFFDLVESCNYYYEQRPNEKSDKPTIWYSLPAIVDGRPIIEWAHGKNKLKSKGALGLYLLHPSAKELENILSDNEAKLNWVRQNLLQNIADYINRQNINYKTVIRGNEIHLEGETSDLFLSYTIGLLMGAVGRKAKFCECGCGNLVPPTSHKYASEICRTRHRDKTDERRSIKKWLRTNRGRGKFNPEDYPKLCLLVDRMYLDGYSPEEITAELKKTFK